MKININKLFFIILTAIGMALGTFTSALSLYTSNQINSYIVLILTYYLAIKTVKSIHKYPSIIKR